MSLRPSLEDQELLAETYRRELTPLSPSERRAEALVGLAFVLAVVGLWVLRPPHGVSLLPAALSLIMLAVSTRVRFDTPLGFTVATQLAFVPVLFALPGALVPPAVALTLIVARLPDLRGRRTTPARLWLELGNAWFAIGPAAVFAIAGDEPFRLGAPVLLLALLAQFAGDILASAVRQWIERGAGLITQLRESWVYGIDAALSVTALVVAEDLQQTPLAPLATVPLLAVLAIFARERHHRMKSLLELNDAYRGTALALSNVVEADDGYTGEHSRGVVRLAVELGHALGLGAERMRNLEFAALLHDVGKVAIPKEIINKPGALDPLEWELVKTHTVEGQRMLERVGGFMRTVGMIVRSHHERWDGRGYPDGLAGEAIPLEARIITCCDSWNAMRTDRAYRRALSPEVARADLLANADHQFDPAVVAAFLPLIEKPGDTTAGVVAAEVS